VKFKREYCLDKEIFHSFREIATSLSKINMVAPRNDTVFREIAEVRDLLRVCLIITSPFGYSSFKKRRVLVLLIIREIIFCQEFV
jgi:hypothetical protein